MMAGWVSGDGSLFGASSTDPVKYKEQAIKTYGDQADKFLKLFPGSTNEEIASSQKALNLLGFAGLPAYIWAGVSKSNAYLYEFTHVPVDKPGFPNYGAFHTSEVPFALHTLHMWNRPWRAVDYAVEKTMNEYWVNFVKQSDPNGKDLPVWTKYDKTSKGIMVIGDESKVVPGLHIDEFEFLKSVAGK
jgi:para-nitrobenzyl esterase